MVTKPALWGSGYTTTGVENSPAPPPTSCYVGRFGFRVLGGTHFTGHPEEHVKPQGRKSYMGPLLIAALLEGQEYHNAKGQHPRRLGLDSIVVSAPSLIKSLLCAVLLSTIGVTTFIPSLGSKSPNLTQLPTKVNGTPMRITTTTKCRPHCEASGFFSRCLPSYCYSLYECDDVPARLFPRSTQEACTSGDKEADNEGVTLCE